MTRNEKLYIEIFDKLDSGFVLLDPVRDKNGDVVDFMYLHVNLAMEKITGKSVGRFIGTTVMELHNGKFCTDTFELFKDVHKNKESKKSEFYSDLINKHLEMQVFPVEDDRIGLINTDITERKQGLLVLQQSEEKFKAIFNGCHDGLIVTNPKTHLFHYVNKAIYDMLGYSEEELIKLGVRNIHPEEELSGIFEQFQKMAENKLPIATDIPVKRKDGSIFYVDITATWLKIDDEDYLQGTFHDVTSRRKISEELKKSRELLRLSEENLQALINSTDDFVISIDKYHRLMTFNNAGEKMLERLTGKKIVVGIKPLDFVTPEVREKYLALYKRALSGEKFTIEFNDIEYGIPTNYEVIYTPIINEGEVAGFAQFMRNITREKLLKR